MSCFRLIRSILQPLSLEFATPAEAGQILVEGW